MQGVVKTRQFDKFEFKVVRSDVRPPFTPLLSYLTLSVGVQVLAREYLSRHSAQHYWDLALSQAVLEEASFSAI